MNRFMNEHIAKIISAAVSVTFLVIHCVLLMIFYQYGVTPMAYFNIFSVSFYFAMLAFIYYGKLQIFVVGSFVEVLVHMGLAVYFVGWGAGFQSTLIGINMLVFFAEYVARKLKMPYVPALPLALASMVVYILSYVITYYHSVEYPLPEGVCYGLQIWWALVVFLITIPCLQSFVWITFNSEEMLSDQATRDKLTGLPNRYYMADYINKLEAAGQMEACWIAIADIDDFKKINDTYGHNFGDYVLKSIAQIMYSFSSAEYCRWGGEEFLIVGKIKDRRTPRERLESFRQSVEDFHFSYEGQTCDLTITVGMALYEKGRTVDEWVAMADKNLYIGKCSGKNQVVV